MHFLTSELRPQVLDGAGIAAAIQRYARQWSDHFKIAVDVEERGTSVGRLSTDAELALYRIVQEALGNVAKHAAPTRASVVLERRDGHVVLTVTDDGCGFDPADPPNNMELPAFGLIGMRERAAIAGGTLEIVSAPGRGTSIVTRLPLEGIAP